MNTVYKILWIDDSDEFVEMTQELVEDVVRQNNMISKLTIYNTFDEFAREELENFDAEIFNLYDQIIVDYALSETTGDKIIQDLRSRNIYTDIVFYSSNFDNLKKELKNSDEHLDGVFYSPREQLTSSVDKVIKKNLKREYNIANIRGLIMDSTSEFDYLCRTVTLELYGKLPEAKQQEIVAKTKEFVANAQTNATRNFGKLEKYDGIKFMKDALSATEYVMKNKDRYAVMALVVREFDDNPIFGDGFSDKYQADLIKPRNDLAHNMLFYGECQKKLHIAKEKQVLKCDKQCDSCKSKYSIENCEELRQKIFDYYLMFTKINQRTDEILKELE